MTTLAMTDFAKTGLIFGVSIWLIVAGLVLSIFFLCGLRETPHCGTREGVNEK